MRTRGARRTGSALLTMAVVALAAGCGGDGVGAAAAPTRQPDSATASATPSPRPTSTPRPTAAPTPRPAVPPGWRVITAKKAGIRFAVPKSWTKVDANELDSPEMREEMDALGESLGATRDQLRSMLKQIDVLVVSATFTPETYGEVQVVPLRGLAEIPSREALRAQLATTRVEIRGFKTLMTPVGPGLLGASQRVIAGEATYTDAFLVQVDNGVISLSVTAATAERCRVLLLKMIESLRDVGKGNAGPGSTIES